jgi:hypothetical protein
VTGHILTEAFAAKPSNGFLNTSNCSNNNQATKRTCCWRDAPGIYKYPMPTYCQTCENDNGGYSNCTDPELQFLIDPDKSGDITNPANEREYSIIMMTYQTHRNRNNITLYVKSLNNHNKIG